jgi:endogenous inhibitor of DNA gyrase (YacG/DUF329 family)
MDEAITGKPCPICTRPAVQRFRPFCSRRCADVDLHRWLSGSYVLPGHDPEHIEPEAPPLAPQRDDFS